MHNKIASITTVKNKSEFAKQTLDSIRASNDPHVMTIYYFLQQIIITNNNRLQHATAVPTGLICHFPFFHSHGKLYIFPTEANYTARPHAIPE